MKTFYSRHFWSKILSKKMMVTSILFLSLFSFGKVFACSGSIEHQGVGCPELNDEEVYVLDFGGFGVFCDSGIFANVTGGEITAANDRFGNDLSGFILNNQLIIETGAANLLPIEMTILWEETGCQEINLFGAATGGPFWCNCFNGTSLEVFVGWPDTPEISFPTHPLNDCEEETFCVEFQPFEDCVDYTWELYGSPQGSIENGCIDFFVTDCPVEITTIETMPCGNVAVLELTALCAGVGAPPIPYSSFVCLGQEWSVVIPGPINNLVVHNSSGNSISRDLNRVFFKATSPGQVIMTVTFEFCGDLHSQFFFIMVSECLTDEDQEKGELAMDRSKDSEQQNSQLGDGFGSFDEKSNELNPRISSMKLFPNPVIDNLNIQTTFDEYQILILAEDGKFVKNFKSNQSNAILDLSDLRNGIYYIHAVKDNQSIVSKIIKVE